MQLAGAGRITEVYRAVEPAYPEEGCGFVFEDEDGALHVLGTKNRATQLHEMDPEQYPRDGRDYFEPDMKPWLQSVRKGWTPRMIFHSHPDIGAYFSATDIAQAVIEDEGKVFERNPGAAHMVVSVVEGKAVVAKVFRFDTERSEFEEVAAFDADGAPQG